MHVWWQPVTGKVARGLVERNGGLPPADLWLITFAGWLLYCMHLNFLKLIKIMSSDTNFQHCHDNKYYASIISVRKYKQLSIATELQTTTVTSENICLLIEQIDFLSDPQVLKQNSVASVVNWPTYSHIYYCISYTESQTMLQICTNKITGASVENYYILQ